MIAVSACLVVSFLVLGRAESTLLGLRVGCSHRRRRRKYWRHQSLGHRLLLIHHHHLLRVGIAGLGQIAKSLACSERQTPDVPNDGRDRVTGI